MAKFHGKDGQIKLVTTGGTPAAPINLKSFSYEEREEQEENKYKGGDFVSRTGGYKSATLSGELDFDSTDTAQADLVTGAQIDVELYPEDDSTVGVKKITGTMRVESLSNESPESGMATLSFTANNDGTMTHGTVS